MSLPSSPAGGGQPLQPVSHNAHRERLFGSPSHRDSSVHDKITQFNTLSLQSKSADAALKRAMLGREEAEAEMRRYREEAKKLNRLLEEWKGEVEESKRQIKESKVRETKVSQRLEEYMVSRLIVPSGGHHPVDSQQAGKA